MTAELYVVCSDLCRAHDSGEEEGGAAFRRLAQRHERSMECGLWRRREEIHTCICKHSQFVISQSSPVLTYMLQATPLT